MEISYQTLAEACDAAGLDAEESLSPRYSGRGMDGKECVGFTYSEDGELFDFLNALENEGIDISSMKSPSKDSMGHGQIAYWRSITATGVPEGVW